MPSSAFRLHAIHLSLAATAGLSLGACTELNLNHCENALSRSPSITPSQFCHDRKVDEEKSICTNSKCPGIERDTADDGCVRESILTLAGIENDHACIVEGPEGWPNDSDTMTGTGTGTDNTTGPTTDPSTTGSSSSSTTSDTDPNDSTSSTSGSDSDSTTDATSGTDTASTTGTTSDTDTTSGTTSDTDSETSSDTTGESGCKDHDECEDMNPAKPWCDLGSGDCVECLKEDHCSDPQLNACVEFQCRPCDDDDDCQDNLNGPACSPENTCVSCTQNKHCDNADKPICGVLQKQECGPCNQLRDQCDHEAACHLSEGTCLDSEILYVNADDHRKLSANASLSRAPDGSKDNPFPTIAEAITVVQGTTDKSGTIHIQGEHVYEETVSLHKNDISTVALFGDGKATIQGKASEAGIEIDGSTVYISNLSINNTDEDGIDCKGQASLWAQQLTIANSGDNGILTDNCSLTLDRSNIVANGKYGVNASDNSLNMTNSIVGGNGNDSTSGAGGLRLGSSVKTELLYVTFANNNNSSATNGKSIHCDGATSTSLRNAIVFGGGTDNIKGCAMLSITTSALDNEGNLSMNNTMPQTTDNTVLDPVPAFDQLFQKPNEPTPDFRLLQAGQGSVDMLKDIAERKTDEDPKVDFEGKPRPKPGQKDWPGADMAD